MADNDYSENMIEDGEENESLTSFENFTLNINISPFVPEDEAQRNNDDQTMDTLAFDNQKQQYKEKSESPVDSLNDECEEIICILKNVEKQTLTRSNVGITEDGRRGFMSCQSNNDDQTTDTCVSDNQEQQYKEKINSPDDSLNDECEEIKYILGKLGVTPDYVRDPELEKLLKRVISYYRKLSACNFFLDPNEDQYATVFPQEDNNCSEHEINTLTSIMSRVTLSEEEIISDNKMRLVKKYALLYIIRCLKSAFCSNSPQVLSENETSNKEEDPRACNLQLVPYVKPTKELRWIQLWLYGNTETIGQETGNGIWNCAAGKEKIRPAHNLNKVKGYVCKRNRNCWTCGKAISSSEEEWQRILSEKKNEELAWMKSEATEKNDTENMNIVPSKESENVLFCGCCPRSFHAKCVCYFIQTKFWICMICEMKQNTDERRALRGSPAYYPSEMQRLLSLVVDSMYKEVCSLHYPSNETCKAVFQKKKTNPMDLKVLLQNVKNGFYRNPEAFTTDVQWIAQNSKFSSTGKSQTSEASERLLKTCLTEINKACICTDCYIGAQEHSKEFLKPCKYPHLLLWVKRGRYNYWPAKLINVHQDKALVSFFGDHCTAVFPARKCYLYSTETPSINLNSMDKNFLNSMEEIRQHIQFLEEVHGSFQFAPRHTHLNTNMLIEHRTYMLPNFTLEEEAEMIISCSKRSLYEAFEPSDDFEPEFTRKKFKKTFLQLSEETEVQDIDISQLSSVRTEGDTKTVFKLPVNGWNFMFNTNEICKNLTYKLGEKKKLETTSHMEPKRRKMNFQGIFQETRDEDFIMPDAFPTLTLPFVNLSNHTKGNEAENIAVPSCSFTDDWETKNLHSVKSIPAFTSYKLSSIAETSEKESASTTQASQLNDERQEAFTDGLN